MTSSVYKICLIFFSWTGRSKWGSYLGGNASYTSYHNGFSEALMAPDFNNPVVLQKEKRENITFICITNTVCLCVGEGNCLHIWMHWNVNMSKKKKVKTRNNYCESTTNIMWSYYRALNIYLLNVYNLILKWKSFLSSKTNNNLSFLFPYTSFIILQYLTVSYNKTLIILNIFIQLIFKCNFKTIINKPT